MNLGKMRWNKVVTIQENEFDENMKNSKWVPTHPKKQKFDKKNSKLGENVEVVNKRLIYDQIG